MNWFSNMTTGAKMVVSIIAVVTTISSLTTFIVRANDTATKADEKVDSVVEEVKGLSTNQAEIKKDIDYIQRDIQKLKVDSYKNTESIHTIKESQIKIQSQNEYLSKQSDRILEAIKKQGDE